MKTATAVVDRSALRHNLQLIRQMAPQSRLIAIVKANAYGHGALEAARVFSDADGYGVSRLSEALALRAGGITKPILLLEGFFCADELPLLAEHQLETAVHCVEQLAALEQATLPHPLKVWMKLDTGMHRLGVLPAHAEAFYARLSSCANVVQPVNVMSHFCRADEPEFDTTRRQLDCFDAFTRGKPGAQSIAASGGILLWPEAHRDQIRPGIILYGVSPLGHGDAGQWQLKPAMTLTSHLIAVREHHAGEPVGYGSTWSSTRDTRLGVVAMGYGDGYPRGARSGTPVWINGREVPLVGRVSMDMLTVDLGPDADDQVGNEVILWGGPLPVENVAAHNDISAYELITRLTARTRVEYIG
ncbi:alanine racemase [Musicola paradisiaca]|uniref:Alanine racemase n=1 Tax=Musicola paradisiaca (strain Ech703) TaxID=579405 RepID=C6CA76_MUSP7|nr:alanine racemase [Musicola paradisiaca]ACS84551.1 alanine racemase [Musicola paradisiaca Ech703]